MAGIYIHIPFCRKACIYCDFHFSTSLKSKTELLKAIVREHELRSGYLEKQEVTSIYFGGGTPSVLNEEDLALLLEPLYKMHSINPHVEITLECNPDDLSTAYMQTLKKSGINRLSVGAQSFIDEELKWMNRGHNAVQSKDTVKRAQDLGFDNISIDLIYGSKFQSEQAWEDNLHQAFDLNIQHLSAYNLTVEKGTALGYFVSKGKEQETDEQLSALHFQALQDAAQKHDFVHYEISNFAKEGYYSRHNSSYWKGAWYLGLGPSAHSFNGVSRQWNISNNQVYIKKLAQNNVPCELEVLSVDQRYNEYILTGLRTIWGVRPEFILREFGQEYLLHFTEHSKSYVQSGHLQQQGDACVLSASGKLLADKIASDLFS